MVLDGFRWFRKGLEGFGRGGEGWGGVGRPGGPAAGGRPAADAAVGRRPIAAHCCGFFSCTKPLVWPVGVVVVAELYF